MQPNGNHLQEVGADLRRVRVGSPVRKGCGVLQNHVRAVIVLDSPEAPEVGLAVWFFETNPKGSCR